MQNNPPKYHYLRKNRANTAMALRVIVAGYLLYMAWKIVSGTMGGGSPIPGWAAWLIGIAMAAAALIFALYAWRRYRADLKAAELTQEELAEDTDRP